MKFSSHQKAFTLIELLVSIAIIGAIISISMVSFGNIRQKARDTKRISDIKLIQKSLEDYYRNEGSYPAILTPGQNLIGSSSNVVYMQVPENPSPRNDGNCPNGDYAYQTINNGNNYRLDFCLSETTAQINAGEKCATPQGILNQSCFACGDQVTITNIAGHVCDTNAPYYDTCIYDTIYIDKNGGHDTSLEGQCWMTKNLNIGRIVDGTANTNNNGFLEKYCYDPDGDLSDYSKCQLEGGLYQWNEAMQYTTTEPNQGICPSGWHIPLDSDLYNLENALKDDGYSCDANRTYWGCDSAGIKMKPGGVSGFEGRLSGNRNVTGQIFQVLDMYGCFWTSTLYSSTFAWDRLLFSGKPSPARLNHDTNTGFSIRCIKN